MPRVLFTDSDFKDKTSDTKTVEESLEHLLIGVPPVSKVGTRSSGESRNQASMPAITHPGKIGNPHQNSLEGQDAVSISRRNVAETYRASQKLSYETVDYYEKMNKVLAGQAAKAVNENKDLNLRISELEAKLLLVAGMIKDRELQKERALHKKGSMMEDEKVKAEREKRVQLERERQVLEGDFERAREEMRGMLRQNKHLVDDNEELRKRLYHMEQQYTLLMNPEKIPMLDKSLTAEVECQDMNVGEMVETEEIGMATDDVILCHVHVNTDAVVYENKHTDTYGLVEVDHQNVMTDPEKPLENIQHAFIFPMFR